MSVMSDVRDVEEMRQNVRLCGLCNCVVFLLGGLIITFTKSTQFGIHTSHTIDTI